MKLEIKKKLLKLISILILLMMLVISNSCENTTKNIEHNIKKTRKSVNSSSKSATELIQTDYLNGVWKLKSGKDSKNQPITDSLILIIKSDSIFIKSKNKAVLNDKFELVILTYKERQESLFVLKKYITHTFENPISNTLKLQIAKGDGGYMIFKREVVLEH